MDFGRVWGGCWEAKILYFPIFFNVFLKLKFERCFESKRLRKKMPNHEVSTHLGPARRNVRGAGERKREGFRSLLGQNSGKKYFLGKHFRCKKIEKELALLIQHARPRWGGGSLRACRRAMIEGRMPKGMTTTWILFPAYSFS